MLARAGARRHALLLACCPILICILVQTAGKALESDLDAGARPPAGQDTRNDITALHAAEQELRGLLRNAQSAAAALEAAAERYSGLLAAGAAAGAAGVAVPSNRAGAAAPVQESREPLGTGEHMLPVLSLRLTCSPWQQWSKNARAVPHITRTRDGPPGAGLLIQSAP